jgi:hypothetical protein
MTGGRSTIYKLTLKIINKTSFFTFLEIVLSLENLRDTLSKSSVKWLNSCSANRFQRFQNKRFCPVMLIESINQGQPLRQRLTL